MVVLLQSVYERNGRRFANETRQKLKSFTGVGVTHGRNEEAEAEGQHENVQHEMLLCGMACGAIRIAFSPRLDGEVPFGA
jgi:hypothetical protein